MLQIAFTPLIASYVIPQTQVKVYSLRPYYRYNIEILPFAIRAKGYTVFSFAVTLSLIFNQ